jgi:hypothetical protein
MASAACAASTTGQGHLGAATGSSGTPTPASPTRHIRPSATPVTPRRSHVAFAEIPLQPHELPPGWTAAKGTNSDSGGKIDDELAACLGGHSSDADQVATVNGDDFSQGSSEISSSVSKYKSQADIDNDAHLLTSPHVDSCLTKSLRQAIASSAPAGGRVNAVSFHITPGSSGGPRNVVATGSGRIALSSSGQTVRIYVDIAFISGPRIEAEVDFTGLGTRIDKSLQRRLVAAVANRTAHA